MKSIVKGWLNKNKIHMNKKEQQIIKHNGLIQNFKNQIKELKKEKMILNIENLITKIKERGLIEGLLTLEKFRIETLSFTITTEDNIIGNIYWDLKEKNSLLFKLELYMPKLYELKLEYLIVWLYKVEIKK